MKEERKISPTFDPFSFLFFVFPSVVDGKSEMDGSV
jgi:hypothetical protein